jgi:AraC-like DNA-binding protein
VFGRAIVRADIEPLQPDEFRAEAMVHQIFGLGVMFATTSAARQGNSHELIASDDLSFATPTCPYSISQIGRSATVGPGDGVLLSNSDVGKVTLSANCRLTALSVPRAAILPLVPDLGAALARPVPAGSPALRFLMRYLDIVHDTQALADVEAQGMVATHVHDLLALTLGATRDAAEVAKGRGLRAARLRAIKADVLKNLGRLDLSVEAVAASHRITPRHVQRLFEQDGVTFTAFVLVARLDFARRLLCDPAMDGVPIGRVAFDSGFSDLSYFNRCFRRRFGCTPSEMRAGRE